MRALHDAVSAIEVSSVRSLFLVTLVLPAVVACGSADTPPLGGPYGGTAPQVAPNDPPPTEGSGSGSASIQAEGDNTAGSGGGSSTPSSSSSSSSESSSSGSSTASSAASSPTWTELYTTYLAAGTVGGCTSCHSEMSSASGAYTWLGKEGQIGGSSPA